MQAISGPVDFADVFTSTPTTPSKLTHPIPDVGPSQIPLLPSPPSSTRDVSSSDTDITVPEILVQDVSSPVSSVSTDTSHTEETVGSDETESYAENHDPSRNEDEDLNPLLFSLSSLRLASRPTTPRHPPRGRTRFDEPSGRRIWSRASSEDESDAAHQEAVPASFAKSIRGIQRTQTLLDQRTTELEKEFASLREELSTSVTTSKSLLRKTQETISKECRTIEQAQLVSTDTVQSLEQKFNKAQLAIATLQAQHRADKEAMERMANDIAEVLAIQDQMGCRLLRLGEAEESILKDTRLTRGLVSELSDGAVSLSPQPDVRAATLADELFGDDIGHHSPSPFSAALALCPASEPSPESGAHAGDDTSLDNETILIASSVVSTDRTVPPSLTDDSRPFVADDSLVSVIDDPSSVGNDSSSSVSEAVNPLGIRRFLHHILVSKARNHAEAIRTVAWVHEVRIPQCVKVIRANVMDSFLREHRWYGHAAIFIIYILDVVVFIVLLARVKRHPVLDTEPVRVSDHPIWDSL
ncbi:hypothetical protein L226DRAFT_577076 [Lentinus tigrinus ALCF2SS1-7]|uniref:uncharacterized protein n=1 Tax=Lentinus tigrinus ALCF2SS1-7 TaxID=1328758 RepID=UPI001165CC24|nr:hypothetical protein L226DRAFT_577076 [Lentinus tigrinus ALCF2SS1-7]